MQPITLRIKINKIFIYFRGNFFNFIPFRIIGRLKIILKIFNLNIIKNPSLKLFKIDRSLIESNLTFKKI